MDIQQLMKFPVFSQPGIFDMSSFEGRMPPFVAPREVGSFSTSRKNDMEREVHNDRRALLPLCRRGPKRIVEDIDVDLTQGKEKYVDRGQKQKDAEHLDPMLKWILKHKDVFYQYRARIGLICWRGRLHKLMITPYNREESWTMVVCRVDGILYMSYVDAEDQKSSSGDERIEDYMYWGFKFEQVMTSLPDDAEALDKEVSNFNSFNSVIYTRVNKTGLLFGAEMDCCDPEEDAENRPGCYVELKTCAAIYTPDDMRKFCGRKLLKYWAQSYICGVPNIMVGFRDETGHIVSTDELPMPIIRKIAQAHNQWDPAVCMNFLDQFLEFVKMVAVDEYDKTIYKFKWTPELKQVVVSRDGPESSWMFLPQWYMTQRPRWCY